MLVVAALVIEIWALVVTGGVLGWTTMVRHEAHVILTVVLIAWIVETSMLHHSLRSMRGPLGLCWHASLNIIGSATICWLLLRVK